VRRDAVTVSPEGDIRTIAAALSLVRSGGRVVVKPGVYREPTIAVTQPVEIVGEGYPTLDGEGARQIMTVTADDVTVRGLRFTHVGVSFVQDRAALKVVSVRKCAILDNRFEDTFFGIYLAKSSDCLIRGNALRAFGTSESRSANGIHLWSSRRISVLDNHVAGHRDGIYLEFVHDSEIAHNVSEQNLRYGLHFMFSDDCRYLDNTFRKNGSGVAVMYTKRVAMSGNRFEENWGAASYGLLLKEIADATLDHNLFARNTTGLLADGVARLRAEDNDFVEDGWAVKLDANAVESEFSKNNFVKNTFDVATNSRSGATAFVGNYWDDYQGYDLDRDGVGDVPHHPVRLFSLIVDRYEPALVLLRSGFVEALDAAERALPVLTPESVVDSLPAMRPIRHREGT